MKRFTILILFILLTVLFVPIKTYAYSETQLDVPINELNNHSLREVFEDGNIIVNGDFNNGLTGWIQENATGYVINGVLEQTATVQYGQYRQEVSIIENNKYYHVVRYKTNNTNIYIRNPFAPNIMTNGNSTWTIFSQIASRMTGATFNVSLQDNRTSGWTVQYLDYIYLYDLTFFGIDTLTVEQLDYWFGVYQFNKEHEIVVSNEGIGTDLMNVIKGFKTLLIDLHDFIMNSRFNILGIDFSFLGLISSGLIILLLAFQIIWLVV